MAVDPVCGMKVDEPSARFTSVYDGKKYFFCAPGCKRTFDSDPGKWLEKGPAGHMPM